MFNPKPYEEVNREERFYCALFSHALLSSAATRSSFSQLVEDKIRLRVSPEQMRVFLEAAVLRDYWNDLGDPRVYLEATHDRRREVLDELLVIGELRSELIDRHGLFWSGGIAPAEAKSKLQSPARWRIPQESSDGLSDEDLKNLRRLERAFNAKPDILLVSGAMALMLEAKLESGEAVYDQGEGGKQIKQTDIQKFIAEILVKLVPEFRGKKIQTCTLGLCGPGTKVPNADKFDFSWAEVARCCDTPEVDAFTKDCFAKFDTRKRSGSIS